MRVDAHQHYWHFDAHRDAWITRDMDAIRRDFLPSDVAPSLRDAQIDAVVAVQASQSEDETDFLLALAQSNSNILGVVGWVDLLAHDLTDRVQRWRGNTVLKGFRHVAQSEPDDFLTRPAIVSSVQQLGALGYSYDLLVYPRQLAAATSLVAQCPDVSFVLDHCAKPPIASGDLTHWRDELAQLAQYPNVTCKLSGLVTEATWHAWAESDFIPALNTVLELFGADRLMFATDWPVCLLSASYAQTYDIVAQWAAASLSHSEQSLVFGSTAQRIYRLDVI